MSPSYIRHANCIESGLPPIIAEVVRSRSSPSWLRRQNRMGSSWCCHHSIAMWWWTCSSLASASQTLISGKLGIDLFVGRIDYSTGSRNKTVGEIDAVFFLGLRIDGLLDRVQDEFASRTSFAGSLFVQLSMEGAREIDAGANVVAFHVSIIQSSDLFKSARIYTSDNMYYVNYYRAIIDLTHQCLDGTLKGSRRNHLCLFA